MLTATLYKFEIEFSDIDAGVYETLNLRVAQHPSEDEERLVVRVLARTLRHEEGLEFGRGLSTTEDAELWSRTPTGEIATWIEVGQPSADRLHRASKAAEQLIVVTHKSETALKKEWSVRRIHRAEDIQVLRLDPEMIARLAAGLERRTSWHVTIFDGQLTVTCGDDPIEGALEQVSLASVVSNAD